MSEVTAKRGWLLLSAVALLITLAVLLCLLAKMPELSTADRTNLNTAGIDDVAAVLDMHPALARRLLFEGGHRRRYSDADAAGSVRLLSQAEAERVASYLHSRGRDLSRITAPDLAQGVSLDIPVAERVSGWLRSVPGEQAPAAVKRAAVISRDRWTASRQKLVVRTGREFALGLAGAVIMLAVVFLVAYALEVRLRLREAWIIFPTCLLLVGIGVVTLVSIKDPLRDGLAYRHHVWGAVAGVCLMLGVSRLTYTSLRRFKYLYALLAVALTILLFLFGQSPARGTRLSLWGLLQPIEIVKVFLVLFVASYLADRGALISHRLVRWKRLLLPSLHDIGPLLAVYAFSLLVLFSVRDLGPVVVLYGAFLAMLYVATGRPLYVGIGALLVVAAGALAYLVGMDVVQTRVDMWLSPWNNARAHGGQLAASYWAFASGGPFGAGIGLGSPQVVPRAGSDLVLASIAEEWGILGVVLVVACFMILLQRCLRICQRTAGDDSFASSLGTGLVSLLGLSTLLIALGAVGLIPLTGVALPFVCYGNSSLIASFVALGVILSLDRSAQAEPQPRRVRVRLRHIGVVFTLALTAVAAKAAYLQGFSADERAAASAFSVDADRAKRGHVNPRLLALAGRMPRGRVLDREGRVVAGRGEGGERVYPYGPYLAHLVGYVDPAYGGPVGLERNLESSLRGFDDYRALVPMLRTKDLPWGPRFRPRDVRLSIDARLQQRTAQILRSYARSVTDARTGLPKRKAAAVLLDVQTGEVLAAASVPSFDPNHIDAERWRDLTQDAGHLQALLDRSRSGFYPPGSAFKIVTATAALETGVQNPVTCANGMTDVRWSAGGQTYARHIRDIEGARAHGRVGLREGLVYSCNVYFARLGVALGSRRLLDNARRFGFSRLPSDRGADEALPDLAMGQGPLLVTPLEMARAVAAIADGGNLPLPRFTIGASPGNDRRSSDSSYRATSASTARSLRAAMLEVTQVGTAHGVFRTLPFSVAGKTGTAENNQGDGQPHSWFVGFAPADRPEVAFAVIVENGGLGAKVAAPAARDILRAWWERRESR